MSVFNNLQALNARTRKRLYRKVKIHFKDIAKYEALTDVYPTAIGTLLGYLIILLFLVIPIVLAFTLKVPSPWTYALLGFIPAAFASLIIWYALFTIMMRFYNAHVLLYFAVFTVLCIINYYLYGWLRLFISAPVGFFCFVVFISVFIGISLASLMIGGILVGMLVYGGNHEKQYSDSYLLTNYAASLYNIEQHGADWTNISLRQKIYEMLEVNARIITSRLPKKIKISDPAIRPWFDQKINEISASTRNLAKLVLLPKEKGDQELIERLSRIIVCLADGNWGGIETAELEKTTTPQRFNYVFNLLKMLLLAFLPISAMWFIQRTFLALQPPVSDYANAGAIIWALLVILNIFDPALSQRISSLKDISSLMSLGKK